MHGLEQALAASFPARNRRRHSLSRSGQLQVHQRQHGPPAGDHVLRIIARRLTVALREYDRIARFGGDEFTILIDDLVNVAQARNIAQRVIFAIEEPIHLKETEVRISASVGIATCMTGETDPEYLLQAADIAMYDAKNAGNSSVSVFRPSMMTGLVERLELERKLRRALTERRIHLVYQPIVNLVTSEIVAVEALARWQDDDGSWITPSTFIPLAEGTGLIIRLGQALLEQACEDIKRLQSIRPELGLNVNISSSELRQDEFVRHVLEIVERTGFDPMRLTLEINEASVMVDTLEAIERLHELKRSGVIVAVDDFGTGHSSLSILQELPVDVLKIDQSFVQRLDTDAEGFEIVRLITVMAKTLRLSTIAEGIETAGQMNALLNLQCRTGQGFLLHQPMPLSDVEQLVSDSTGTDSAAGGPGNPPVSNAI
ncbi:MAG: bifunctional diguanylate cyclase/phosphodiesterase [Thermomicrobiales bacterium]